MTEHRELRDRDDAESWLAAGMCLMRLAEPNADEYVAASPWILGALSESGRLPPAGVIADIGHLLTGRSLRSVRPLPNAHAALRDAMSSYEDHVLGRLEADPRLDAVVDAVARLPVVNRDQAVSLFCTHLLARLGFARSVSMSPGVARRVMQMPVLDLLDAGRAVLTEAGSMFDVLLGGYRGLISSARRMGSLISEAEVFLMENLRVLGEYTQRLAIEQMIEVSDALARALPRRLKPRAKPGRGFIPTPLLADDNYPTGGFSSLSTSGSLENLVVSELIYMEDKQEDIDLFDLRYAEGELLYYTRDESVFVRNRRVITFALMPELQRARFKDPDLSWQRLVVVLGLITCAVKRLSGWLEGDGLTFRLNFVLDERGRDPLASERALATILLHEWIDREIAEVTVSQNLADVIAQASDDARAAETSFVVISPDELAGEDVRSPTRSPAAALRQVIAEPPVGVLSSVLSVANPEPALQWSHRPSTPRAMPDDEHPGDEALWQSWIGTALELLQELL